MQKTILLVEDDQILIRMYTRKFEKEGFEIKDKLGYARADLDHLLEIRKGVIEKEGHLYLKKKEEKKK